MLGHFNPAGMYADQAIYSGLGTEPPFQMPSSNAADVWTNEVDPFEQMRGLLNDESSTSAAFLTAMGVSPESFEVDEQGYYKLSEKDNKAVLGSALEALGAGILQGVATASWEGVAKGISSGFSAGTKAAAETKQAASDRHGKAAQTKLAAAGAMQQLEKGKLDIESARRRATAEIRLRAKGRQIREGYINPLIELAKQDAEGLTDTQIMARMARLDVLGETIEVGGDIPKALEEVQDILDNLPSAQRAAIERKAVEYVMGIDEMNKQTMAYVRKHPSLDVENGEGGLLVVVSDNTKFKRQIELYNALSNAAALKLRSTLTGGAGNPRPLRQTPATQADAFTAASEAKDIEAATKAASHLRAVQATLAPLAENLPKTSTQFGLLSSLAYGDNMPSVKQFRDLGIDLQDLTRAIGAIDPKAASGISAAGRSEEHQYQYAHQILKSLVTKNLQNLKDESNVELDRVTGTFRMGNKPVDINNAADLGAGRRASVAAIAATDYVSSGMQVAAQQAANSPDVRDMIVTLVEDGNPGTLAAIQSYIMGSPTFANLPPQEKQNAELAVQHAVMQVVNEMRLEALSIQLPPAPTMPRPVNIDNW